MNLDQIPFGPHFGFGVYIHWPYCSKICPYCDFNVFAAKDRDTDALAAAMAADIRGHKAKMPRHGPVDTVYFGGGTPALMRPDQISLMLYAIAETFGIKSHAEITLEANPNDVVASDITAWAAAGINRLSIGVQSLSDQALQFLGRDHDAATAQTAVAKALSVFPNTSIDLIYALPGQSDEHWRMELASALALGAPHLSLYELTLERATAFGKAAERGELVPLSDDRQAELYEITQAMTDAAGLAAYEVSNHARGIAYQSRHNLAYWNGADWIGAGPGAHGRVSAGASRFATIAERRPDAYVARVQTEGVGWSEATELTRLDIAREVLAMGLRPSVGVDLARIEAIAGVAISLEKMAVFQAQGWMGFDGQRAWLSPSGRLLADAITAELSP